jgi:hypothetical protein
MPEEYDMAVVSGYARTHAHFGELLSIYSQPICCCIMTLLREGKEISVSEIRDKFPLMKPYILSRHLTLLYEKKHILKAGKIYTLNNDIFYRNLSTAATRILHTIKKVKKSEVTPEEIAMTSSLFSSMIYDDVSNILIHILLKSPRTLNEIVDIYRSNHGYVPSSIIRYHLTRKKYEYFGEKIEIFDLDTKRYALSSLGRACHEIFDEFMGEYIRDNEDWMRQIWTKPIKELVSDRVSMAQPGDKFYKVLRMLGKTDFVIVRGNKAEGVVTIQHALSMIGRVIDTDNFWGSMTAREVMLPIKAEDILSGKETLREIYQKRGEFVNTDYIVEMGGGNYTVLDLNKVSKIMNDT